MSNVITYGILINRKRECNNKITEKNKSCKKRKEKKRKTTICISTLSFLKLDNYNQCRINS